MSASTQARRAALAHMLFNVFGVVWVLIVFRPFVDMVCKIIGYDQTFVPSTPEEVEAVSVRLTYVLAAFHTTFNVCNVLILIWFVKPIERIVSRAIPQKAEDEEGRLRFISSGLLSTAELSLFEARKEINLFAERCRRMFSFIPELLMLKDENDFNKLYTRVEKYEGISDNMEIEIANYLNKVSEGRLSPESKNTIRSMLREISELESICDSCFNLARTLDRKHKGKEDFTEGQYKHIGHMFGLCMKALDQMVRQLNDEVPETETVKSLNIENEINNYRSQLKEMNLNDINEQKYDYQMGVNYMDIIGDCEKLGDYVINVVEAHSHKKLSM